MVVCAADKGVEVVADGNKVTKQKLNAKETYMMQQWELFGYLDYINYTDFLKEELRAGNIDEETYNAAARLGGL